MQKRNSAKKFNVKDNHSLIREETPFAVREAFGLLRTNILYTSYSGEGAPVLGVASVGESSGKSTIISNLAYSFANTQKKVLLIDADMRCPVQQEFFGYKKSSKGLSEILSGIVTDAHETIHKTNSEYLDVIPSGHVPPNPSELVLSPKLGEFISQMKKEYDYIFVDFPPIGVVSDAVSAVNHIDGYIFVIRANVTDRAGIKDCLNNLEKVGGNVVGIVLNDVNYKDGMFGGKYKSKYGKYSKYSKYVDAAESSSETK